MFSYLCAHNFPIGAVAGVTVFIPFDSIKGDVSINRARFPHHCGINAPAILEKCFDLIIFVLLDSLREDFYLHGSGDRSCLVDTDSGIH